MKDIRVTHPLRVAENCPTHPLHKAQNLMTHPLSAPAHPPILFDQSLIRADHFKRLGWEKDGWRSYCGILSQQNTMEV